MPRSAPPATAPPTPEQMAELWHAPEPNRDLFWGVGGERLAPDPSATYKVLEIKRAGFSMGMTVEGPDKRKWSAKMPPEAPTEVVASRLLWGVGYHQPPIYYVGQWNAEDAPDPNPQLPARFRESKPDLHGLDAGEHLVVLPEPVRRHARAERTARAAGDARQLRSEGRAERALHAEGAVRRGVALVRRARPGAVVRPHRRARRAARRPRRCSRRRRSSRGWPASTSASTSAAATACWSIT